MSLVPYIMAAWSGGGGRVVVVKASEYWRRLHGVAVVGGCFIA